MTRFRSMSVRVFIVFLLVIGCFVFAGMKMYEIQITRHDELFRKAKEKYTTRKTEKMLRGVIRDYDGHLLVGNRFVTNIAFDAETVTDQEKRKAIAHFLSDHLPPSPSHSYLELFKRLNSGDLVELDRETGEYKRKYRRYIVLARDIDYELSEKIRQDAQGLRLKGLIFHRVNRRTYPKNEMLANILGYSNINGDETEPVTGLEKAYKGQMESEDFTVTFERTRDGRPIGYGNKEQSGDGRNGYDIYLTIREPLQGILEEELDKLYRDPEVKPNAAYAVMADPYTGDILAIAQRPTFNPNDRSTMRGEAYRIRVASDMFEPGSVMKPFVISMALDRKVISTTSRFSTGFRPWKYAGRLLGDTHYIGTVTPRQIIQNSSNIGTAMIAVEMGPQKLYETLKAFHFGDKTGLPLKPEYGGIVKPPEKWSKLSVSRICIGHEVMVTPLQLVRAYCILANGGYPVNLRLVDAIEDDENGKRKEPYQIGTTSVFRNPKTRDILVDMLKTVTKPGGTATPAAVPGFSTAGKTGTANKVENGHYSKEKYFVSFCGFIPADNPRFVLLVTTDEPHGKQKYGGSVSGPVFSKIAERTLQYLGVKPEMSLEDWKADWKACEKAHWADVQRREKERLSGLKKTQSQ